MTGGTLLDLLRRRQRQTTLASFLGKLELQVLDVLWTRWRETSVRDLEPYFGSTAYTTLMTTLDRLHKKGLLHRTKSGRAYLYMPRFTRAGLEAYLAEDAFATILEGVRSGASARPLLMSFVEAVSRRDALLLDELERLVKEKRRARHEEEE
ncbi:MAG TPA: BlaI/MecI/CopY family transcriptional regulator [Vicinamibacteria bacterium]|nr:BlaI/MecI/CopY family transcriptional regulator [Vicinamibacteria bacterium]